MLSTLRELGLISARYAEEEAKQRVSLTSGLPAPTATIGIPVKPLDQAAAGLADTPLHQAALQKAVLKNASIPPSPLISNSPLNGTTDFGLQALLPLLTQRASLPNADKLQQFGLGLLPLGAPFQSVLPPSEGLLVHTPFGFATLPALPTTSVLRSSQSSYVAPSPPSPPPAPQPQAQQQVTVFSSLQSSRLRKPFHKRRPAHMDKSMLFCHFCGRKETPEWRKGPAGPATLCNACGLQWAKKVRAQRNSNSSRSSATTSVQDTQESVASASETGSVTTKEIVTDASKQDNATTA